MLIIFDTETTGLPENYNADITDVNNWPRIVQISWQIYTLECILVKEENYIIKPYNFEIPFNSTKIHKITHDYALKHGHDLKYVLKIFNSDIKNILCFVGHNLVFDIKVISCEFFRLGLPLNYLNKKIIDTKEESLNFCAIKLKATSARYKWPTLSELHMKLFDEEFSNLHNSIYDVMATAKCFFKLIIIGVISINKLSISELCLLKIKKNYFNQKFNLINNIKVKNIINYKKHVNKKICNKVIPKDFYAFSNYFHIHNHTLFSILNSTISIKSLIDKACELNMSSVGITDYGNMMGAFIFLDYIKKKKMKNINIKGIVGSELFISNKYLQKKFTKDQKDIRFNQVFLAKNKKGYYNLSRLCSEGYLQGYYSCIPRIGFDLIKIYKEGLIALSGDLNSQIPYTILNKGEKIAEDIFLWWCNIFKDNFYVELLRHGLEEEEYVNQVLLKLAVKYKVKYIPQNNNYYINQNEANAHDILLCIKNGEKQETPIGNKKGKGFRFGLPNDQFYFKSVDEMKVLFQDLPEAFTNLQYLNNQIEVYDLNENVTIPKFDIPNKYSYNLDNIDRDSRGDFLYFKDLVLEGLMKRYSRINDNVKNRLDFELNTIYKSGYLGYFLIIRDIIIQAKKLNIFVGPGRGSVAGSLIAYCIGITDVDPIKYNLLFERFLNPDRVSLPDIDIDFDDQGRDEIIKFVLNKYGYNQVAQIGTYGTMGAKSAIRDTGRVLGLPLYDTDYIAKLIPNNISLNDILFREINYLKYKYHSNDISNILEIRSIFNIKKGLKYNVINQARIIEGSIRHIGLHACGIIITSYNIKDKVPVRISKDSKLIVTQFDNSVVEKVGLLKMDFLGLKTLTILRDALYMINKKYNINLTTESISLEDKSTYKLFQKGETVAIFQYESEGMQKYLKDLKPDNFNDLIAMNALYRPGPMKYIPSFIARKHGKEKIKYDLQEMKEFLSDTYGIAIYQEQVMLIAQKLAGFSKGDADKLRVAMGKKQKHILDKMKSKFLQNSINRGYSELILNKIWNDWEKFALYAFNKSHSTCYSMIAFQAAFLKTHYPSHYMSAVLSNNMDNISDIAFFIDECKRMNIVVLHPNINKSYYGFFVNNSNNIVFGMGAIKGVGKLASNLIIHERNKNGEYKNIFDFINRIDLRIINKKVLENLIYSGSFDDFNISRSQYFIKVNDSNFVQDLINYGNKLKLIKKNLKYSLFHSVNHLNFTHKPDIPKDHITNNDFILIKEKEVIGVYLKSHPLDRYVNEVKYLVDYKLSELSLIKDHKYSKNKNYYTICGIVTKFKNKVSYKYSTKYIVFTIEDYSCSKEFYLFGDNYLKFKDLIFINSLIYLKINLYYNNANVKINILNIVFLHEVLNKYCKQIILYINLLSLNIYLIYKLKKIFINSPGKKYAEFIIDDKLNNSNIKFIKTDIDITSDLLHNIKLLNLKYKLLKL